MKSIFTPNHKKRARFCVFFLALFLFFIPFIYASDPASYYKAGDNISIDVPCINNGTYCSKVNAICNITIIDPKSDTVVNNKKMYNYDVYHTYYMSNATTLGDYAVSVQCYDGIYKGHTSFTIQLNNIGRKIENFSGLIFFFLSIFMIGLIVMIIFIYKQSVIMYPMMIANSLMLTVINYLVYMNTISLSNIFYALYWVSLLLTVAVFLITMWELTMQYLLYMSRRGKEKRDFKDNY